MMRPFIPLEVEKDGLMHRVRVLSGEMCFGADALPVSMRSEQTELLAGAVRVCGVEDGRPIVWDTRYPENESESFLQCRSAERAVLCGAMASPRFIVDTCVTAEYDGNIQIDLKVMPRGKTVAQVFGIAESERIRYQLDRLWLEIPIRKEMVSLFSMFPESTIRLKNGEKLPVTATSCSGEVPVEDVSLPFKALLWLGNEDRGLGFFAESAENWQPADPERTLEICHFGEETVLRVRLLDSHPKTWQEDPAEGSDAYAPLTFSFGLQMTPVKPFPRNPYPIHGLHLDCFVKIPGNYGEFLSRENRFDRLKRMGVDTLILHEKWNKSQNWFELSEFTRNQLSFIVSECHRRGIRVLTYFGYEISSLAPVFSKNQQMVRVQTEDGKQTGGWYRVPFQRDYVVCYNTQWQERFLKGIAEIMDTCHIDGIYLDGTSRPLCCANELHGCGYRDADGTLHGTYPIQPIRRMFQKLYQVVHSRGGIINVHAYGYQNFTALPYIDLSWYGENLQTDYVKGNFRDVPLPYFRAEYTGRNMGVPVEFIAYEHRPVWNFENAIAIALVHGILPRPNDIEGPLEQMAKIWQIMDRFPVEQSTFHPYWNNGAEASDDKVKISYYRYESLGGHSFLLVFCANTSKEDKTDVTIRLQEKGDFSQWKELSGRGDMHLLKAYDYRIFWCE